MKQKSLETEEPQTEEPETEETETDEAETETEDSETSQNTDGYARITIKSGMTRGCCKDPC